ADVMLVIAGRLPAHDSAFTPDPRPLAAELGIAGRVIFTGWVDEADKPALYSLAEVFVFPSLYEGFGLPVLEALACAG
ncbi:MAG: glycosyltransferase, partial [Anaerolineae bacterium]